MAAPFVLERFSLATSGSTQDFTISGETRTPVAAYFYLIGATTNATSTDHHIQCWGATDGTNQWYGSIKSDHDDVIADCSTVHNTDAVVVTLDGSSTIVGQLSFNSFITAGVRLDIDSTPAAARLLSILFFFEGDYQVGTVTTGSTAGVATGVSVSGFSPTFIIPAEFGPYDFSSTVRNDCQASVGFVASNSGALQAVGCYYERDNTVTTECAEITDNAYGSGYIDRLATGGGEAFTQYAFTTAGFSATPINQNVAHYIGYLCGDVPGMSVWAGHLVTPAGTTGSYEFTEPGQEGSYGIICQTALRNESHTTGAATEGFGTGLFTSSAQFSGCGSSDDNLSLGGPRNTVTKSYASTNLIDFQAPPGTSFYTAAWTASTSSGFTVNITNGNALTRLIPAIVFETFATYEAVGETLGISEEVNPLGLVAVDETEGITETTPSHGLIAVDETLGLVEEVNPLTGVAVGETLGISEEVGDYEAFSPGPSYPVGEGGISRVDAGEGGSAGVEAGRG